MLKWSSLCIPWVVEVGGVYSRSPQAEVQYFIFIAVFDSQNTGRWKSLFRNSELQFFFLNTNRN